MSERELSWEPDPHMAWIYDRTHPDYSTDYARDLRERRERALLSVPNWAKPCRTLPGM